MTLIYKIKNLKHSYSSKIAFQTKELVIEEASITGVNGPNGAGKSTLLNILALIQKPTSGTVFFKDKAVQPFSRFASSRITILSQNPYLLKRSVFNNVAYGLKIRKDTKDLKQRVYKALESVGLPGETFANRTSTELSGGESKRVALAARLILKPDVLILDEPTANIDAESSLLIRKAALNARKEQGTTLIISSHDKDWLYDVCDTVLNVFNGRLIKGKRISLIFGPWENKKEGNGLFINTGSNIVVLKPPRNNSVAVFSAEDFTVCSSKTDIPENLSFLEGKLSTVTMERQSKTIFGTLKLKEGDISVTVKLQLQNKNSSIPSPDQTIFACYDPKVVTFA